MPGQSLRAWLRHCTHVTCTAWYSVRVMVEEDTFTRLTGSMVTHVVVAVLMVFSGSVTTLSMK